MTRVFAIPVGTRWIELRSGKKPPKYCPSVVKKEIEESYHDWTVYPHVVRTRKRMVQLKQFIYTGGKVLLTLPARKFTAVTKLAIRPGGYVEVSEELKPLLLPMKKGR